MPCRRDIDPTDLPTLLPNLQLIDVALGDRFRYRLIGTALVEAFGRDYTGQYADELFVGVRAESIATVYRAVRDGQTSMFLRSRYLTTKDIDLVANRLYLPLSGNGRDVNMILGALTFEFGAAESVAGAWGSARLDTGGSRAEVVDVDRVLI